MDTPIDSEKTIEVIERMKLAKIGKYKKWESMIKKIKKEQDRSNIVLDGFTPREATGKKPVNI